MADFQIKRQVLNDNVLSINPGRLLDNNNAHIVAETITAAHTEGFKYVIIDMSDLEFLSSAGVGSILGTIEIFRETGGDIILCNVSSTVLHVLNVLDLGDYLTIKDCQEEALSACKA